MATDVSCSTTELRSPKGTTGFEPATPSLASYNPTPDSPGFETKSDQDKALATDSLEMNQPPWALPKAITYNPTPTVLVYSRC